MQLLTVIWLLRNQLQLNERLIDLIHKQHLIELPLFWMNNTIWSCLIP